MQLLMTNRNGLSSQGACSLAGKTDRQTHRHRDTHTVNQLDSNCDMCCEGNDWGHKVQGQRTCSEWGHGRFCGCREEAAGDPDQGQLAHQMIPEGHAGCWGHAWQVQPGHESCLGQWDVPGPGARWRSEMWTRGPCRCTRSQAEEGRLGGMDVGEGQYAGTLAQRARLDGGNATEVDGDEGCIDIWSAGHLAAGFLAQCDTHVLSCHFRGTVCGHRVTWRVRRCRRGCDSPHVAQVLSPAHQLGLCGRGTNVSFDGCL